MTRGNVTPPARPIAAHGAAPTGASPAGPVAPELPVHGYVITKPVRGSDIPMDLTFVLTRDEIYVPIAVRKPRGGGPFPVITMGRGDGRAGLPHVEKQVDRLAAMQDRMIERGYVVVYVNYRNEIPHLYEQVQRARNLPDDMSGGENRTLKPEPWSGSAASGRRSSTSAVKRTTCTAFSSSRTSGCWKPARTQRGRASIIPRTAIPSSTAKPTDRTNRTLSSSGRSTSS